MICPLMSEVPTEANSVECKKEKCAWWIKIMGEDVNDRPYVRKEGCAIKILAEKGIK